MAKYKNRILPPSQKPGFSQASTRPAAQGEAALDNQRIPSPATVVQSQADAERSDPYRYVPDGDRTDTDAAPDEATDLLGGDDTVMQDADDDTIDHIAEHEAMTTPVIEELTPFVGFDEPEARGVSRTVVIDAVAQQQLADAEELVPVLPRRTVMRTKIGTKWYNFIKGQEQFVPGYVRDHLVEKAVI